MATEEKYVKKGANETPIGYEPVDKDWGVGTSGMVKEPSPFSRINSWREEFIETPLTIDHERACLWTEAMKENEAKSTILKSARALAHVLRNVSIYINDYELIVGNMAAPPRSAPVFPEFSYDWFVDELKNDPFKERENDRYLTTEEAEEKLESIHDYWKNNTVHDMAREMMSEEELKGTGAYGKGMYMLGNYFFGGVGHISPNYITIFNNGWKGLKEIVEKKISQLDETLPDDLKKKEFYTAQLTVIEGTMDFIKRYAKLAREKASKEEGQRKEELLQIADNCEWISENPPRNFWEALQLWWFATTIILIESNGHSITYGRFDQYMYPYYKEDMDNNTFTKDFVQELIEGAWIKISELTKVRDKISTKSFGGVELGGPTMTVGGLDRDGNDATNDLTFMCLDATAHVRLHAPWMTTRWHSNSPDELWVKAIKVAKLGFGLPSFFNDECIIPSMTNRGRTLEDARDYTIIGCVEPDAWGQEYGWHDSAFFNINKVFELAINDGKCIDCSSECFRYDRCVGRGEQMGIKTGKLSEFKSIEEVKEAYQKQMKYWVDRLVKAENCMDFAHQERKPLPYLSLLINDCTERGIDVTAGGAKYNFNGPQGVGVGNVADGLSAINKLVYEDGEVSGEEMLKALQNNWEGYEDLYALVNSSKIPHYGNDNDVADEYARFAADAYCKQLENRPTAHGGVFQPGLYPVSGNVACGSVQGATPEGRVQSEPIADGVSPVHTKRGSHDVKGPTAVALSVSKLDHEIASNGTLLNMKFTPSTLAGEVGDENFISMMKVYFRRKGMHNQINVISRETLEDARKRPEEYKGLLVRVAGYSAFFTELDDSLQKDLIERTELAF
ncbi:glycyl radical protein [Natranaerofaba carboxydovora]|uniref:glycyl radical protein n=1 Tax=Natranaerofaba carboxydovora TaxID=2742683 RepID=UPI001F140732|nr:formate C-acetyltransferase/glycerol dehydratase family glycyl radical enzyme [Natranaerofaba carboxydovora]UMZ72722.1 Choline trimethylamine-lyase [Natranaerofaba carboxydovora]